MCLLLSGDSAEPEGVVLGVELIAVKDRSGAGQCRAVEFKRDALRGSVKIERIARRRREIGGAAAEYQRPVRGVAGGGLRRFCQILRAADCPLDILSNRVRTIDLRLTGYGRAVHSDMLEWCRDGSAEAAALQLLNVIFAVPQISMKLDELPLPHRAMLKFWLEFIAEHRQLLYDGRFYPAHPEANYPLATARHGDEELIVVYSGDLCLKPAGRRVWIVNASAASEVLLDLPHPAHCRIATASGTCKEVDALEHGLVKLRYRLRGWRNFR